MIRIQMHGEECDSNRLSVFLHSFVRSVVERATTGDPFDHAWSRLTGRDVSFDTDRSVGALMRTVH